MALVPELPTEGMPDSQQLSAQPRAPGAAAASHLTIAQCSSTHLQKYVIHYGRRRCLHSGAGFFKDSSHFKIESNPETNDVITQTRYGMCTLLFFSSFFTLAPRIKREQTYFAFCSSSSRVCALPGDRKTARIFFCVVFCEFSPSFKTPHFDSEDDNASSNLIPTVDTRTKKDPPSTFGHHQHPKHPRNFQCDAVSSCSAQFR